MLKTQDKSAKSECEFVLKTQDKSAKSECEIAHVASKPYVGKI